MYWDGDFPVSRLNTLLKYEFDEKPTMLAHSLTLIAELSSNLIAAFMRILN